MPNTVNVEITSLEKCGHSQEFIEAAIVSSQFYSSAQSDQIFDVAHPIEKLCNYWVTYNMVKDLFSLSLKKHGLHQGI